MGMPDYNIQPTSGLLIGLDPDYQLKQHQLAAADAFKNGVPTDASGNIDYGAMAKTLFSKGAYEPAGALVSAGVQQQGIGLALKAADALGGSSGAPSAASPAASPSGYTKPAPGFDSAVGRTLGFEGGLNPSDTNGTPSNYGINQGAHPNIDVTKLTPEQAKSIYKSDYWDAIGADKLPPALSRAAFDTAVIAGPEKAKELIAASGGDPMKLMSLREEFQRGLIQQDPQKYGPYAKAWAARNNGLRYDILALNAQSGQGGGAPAAPTTSDAGMPQPAPAAAPVRVAESGTSDVPTDIHPYGGARAPAGGSPQPAPPAAAPTMQPVAVGPASNPPQAGVPQAAQPQSAVDPTLGGLLRDRWVGDPGGYITALRAQGVRLAALGQTAAAGAYNQQATMVENALTRSETPEIKNYAVALRQGYQGTMMDFSRDKVAQEEAAKLTAQGRPDVLRAVGQKAQAEAAGTGQGKTPYELVPMQPTPGGPIVMVPKSQVLASNEPMVSKQPPVINQQQEALGKTISALPDQMRQRQVTRERIDAMTNLLEAFQSGADADTKAALLAKARAYLPEAWGSLPDTATANPAAVEQFWKNAQANVFSQIKDQGGKVLVSEIQGFQKANANPNMQPASNAAILAQQKGLLDWQDAHDQALMNWYHANPYSYDSSKFEADWEKANPPGQYVSAARKEIAPRGLPVPSPDQRTVGQRYNIPGKGTFRWMGNGWAQ